MKETSRVCVECGGTFWTRLPQQKCCGFECSRERQLRKANEHNARVACLEKGGTASERRGGGI